VSTKSVNETETTWLGEFKAEEVVGEGAFGKVYRGINKKTKETVAIKVIDLEKADEDFDEVQIEIAILADMRHPAIVAYHGSFVNHNELWIIMEFLSGGSCRDVLDQKILFPEECVAVVMRELLLALAYVHKDGRVHRDVKAANIMLGGDGNVKLVDFGVAAQMSTRATKNTFVGTPFWIAPEIIKGFGYNHKADIWSAGITAIELAEGYPPYVDLDPMKVLHLIPKAKPPELKSGSKIFKDFVAKCLVRDPRQRMDTKDILKHKFLKKAKKNEILVKIVNQYKDAKAKSSSTDQKNTQNTDQNKKNEKIDDWDWDF